MRLINTTTLKLEGPFMGSFPPYAILSHTWGDEELSLQQFTSSKPNPKLKGFQKIKSASTKAAQAGWGYLWVDTVCIDKTSSAELSEAINSMFNWYERAQICYVSLEDYDQNQDLGKCRWFSRGWTLQELLAPDQDRMIFFDGNWKRIGTKYTLLAQISQATLINQACLAYPRSVWIFSVADRMSWASTRKTTRPEDIAYCLLGLFRVNMPLLYGEGAQRAFLRLQHEILQATSDQTIFAWSGPNFEALSGALATSPEYFDARTSYRPTQSGDDESWVAITKQGVSFHAKFRGHIGTGGRILIKCQRAGSFETPSFSIIPLMTGTNQVVRRQGLEMVPPERLSEFSEDVTITLRTDLLEIMDFVHENPFNYLAIVRQPSPESGYLPPQRPTSLFDTEDAIVSIVCPPFRVLQDMQGDILSFRPADAYTTPFIVALYRLTDSPKEERTLSPTSSLRFSGHGVVGVYSHQLVHSAQPYLDNLALLRNVIRHHVLSDVLLSNFTTQLVPAPRSTRDGLDVWTLAGGELVHVAVNTSIDPRLGYEGCVRILAGTCWETHIKALADWGPLTRHLASKSRDVPPSSSKNAEGEDGESSALADEVKEDGESSALAEGVKEGGESSTLAEEVKGDGESSALAEEVKDDGQSSALAEEVKDSENTEK